MHFPSAQLYASSIKPFLLAETLLSYVTYSKSPEYPHVSHSPGSQTFPAKGILAKRLSAKCVSAKRHGSLL